MIRLTKIVLGEYKYSFEFNVKSKISHECLLVFIRALVAKLCLGMNRN